MKLFLNDKLGEITFESTEAPDSNKVLIIAHGAGAGMHHPFMVDLSNAIASLGIHAVRFNFPYMEQGRRAPGSPKDAIAAWKVVIEAISTQYPQASIFISGKSYGGRMASHLLAEDASINAKGIIYIGFPLHAPGRDSKDRANHLGDISIPQLFIQGTKDKLANFEMINEVVASLPNAEIKVIENGDHSFKVSKSVGISKQEMIEKLAKISSDWINHQLG